MNTKLKNNMCFKSYLEEHQQRINHFLAHQLPLPQESPQHLHEAMHYVVFNGGKRMRPLLVYSTGAALGIDSVMLDYAAGAIELIHAYSLVHDDLPAMDNDDLRRGKPTCHKAYDEGTAILVGDALQSLAFKLLADSQATLPPHIQIKLVNCLASASGSSGMAGGQALDLKATGQYLNAEQLELVHQLKTGALISACVEIPLLISDTPDLHIAEALLSFAKYLGLCFQIQDDILDIEGSTDLLGKNIGADVTKQKATYTTIHGLKKAKTTLNAYHTEAIQALSPLGVKAYHLKLLADFIVTRDH